jgi:chlorobactene glucosyltransferase
MSPRFPVHIIRTSIINSITTAVAAGLLLNRRRNPEIEPESWPEGEAAPRVEIIVPARNEVSNVAPLLESLFEQRYPASRWHITLVDDGSTDGTAAEVSRVTNGRAKVRIISAGDLPQDWTGKSHALYTGFLASPPDAEWLLFVDADTRHHPLMLPSLVRRAQESRADLLSLVIDVRMESFWERLLIPQIGELYTLLVGSMDSVNKRAGSAAANGQCMLVRRELFGELGKEPQVRGDVAEDRALAFALKSRGRSVRLEYGRKLVSARVYSSLSEMWSGYAKTLFWASGSDTTRALLVAAALSAYALLPLATLVGALSSPRDAQGKLAFLHASLQIAPQLALRAAVCRLLRVPTAYALLYPLAVTLGNTLLLYSLYRVRSGRGVTWKGRTYR